MKHPVVRASDNGADADSLAGDASSENYRTVEYFDELGRLLWAQDARGYFNYYEYDTLTGALTKEIIDALPASMTAVPTGDRPTRSGLPTALELTTTLEVDGLGRTTKVTDPNGVVTYTAYDDTLDDDNNDTLGTSGDDPKEVRTYVGWDGGAPTGPIYARVTDARLGYVDTLTYSWSGTGGNALPTSGGEPTGAEGLTSSYATIRSLQRQRLNVSRQVIEDDLYVSLPTGSYLSSGELTSSYGTAGTHYLATVLGYNSQGLRYKVKDPTGTWRYMLYDGRGLVTSEWVGTDDSGATQSDPDGSGGGNNMVRVASYAYDDNGNLWSAKQWFGDGTSDFYETRYRSDYRNRSIGMRGPDKVAQAYTLDNLGRQTAVQVFADGDEDFVIDTGELRGKAERSFDAHGRVFRSYRYEVGPDGAPDEGAEGARLRSDHWYDLDGNLLKTRDANGLFQKATYDGPGRLTHSYLSYSSDRSATTGADSEAYADADDVTGDRVLEQAQTIYDKGGRVVSRATFERTPASPSTGALAANNSFLQASVNWYDTADRLIAAANYGRDNGSTRYVFNSNGNLKDADSDGLPDEAEATPRRPNTSDDYIVNKYEYDAAGRLYRVGDNLSATSSTSPHPLTSGFDQFTYDLAGRQMQVVENYADGTAGEAETATDRTTNYVYDAYGRLEKLVALNPLGSGNGVESQETRYVYGSTIDRNWLTHTIYPDSDDTHSYNSSGVASVGDGIDSTYDRVETTYDRLGRQATMQDQRGVLHTYEYYPQSAGTGAGQLKSDRVSLPGGSAVDASVLRHEWAYDDQGRMNLATSYDAATSGNIVNQVALTRDGWGNTIKSQQSHGGAVTTGTPAIEYVFAESGSTDTRYVRLEKVKYPSGATNRRELAYAYGTAGGDGDVLSRVHDVGGYATYGYIGGSRILSETRTNGSSLSYDDSSSSGTVDGLDRFGRIVRQHWGVVDDVYNDVSTYTYDRNSNRLTRDVTADGMSDFNQDEQYTYDGLDRLASFNRGLLSGGSISGGNLKFQQSWSTLDSLGNWRSFAEDADGFGGSSAVSQSRTHNKANEVTAATGNSPSWATPAHDAAGNMTAMPKPGNESVQLDATYDAWNRMSEVEASSTLVGTYRYDALGRRVTKTVSGTTEHTYWDEDYRAIEVRKDTSTEPAEQTVFGQRYIDAPILRERDTIPDDGSLDASFAGDGIVTTDVGASDYGHRLAIQSDGKVLVVGTTTSSTSDFIVVRYRGDGTLDTSFGGGDGIGTYDVGTDDTGYAVTELPSGKILVAGRAGGDTVVLRLNSDGALDTTFDTDGIVVHNFGGGDGAFDMTVDSAGKIYLAGYDSSAWMVARLTSAGALDTLWGTGGEANVELGSGEKAYAIAIDSQGRAVVVGMNGSNGTVARFTMSGVLDTNFDGDGKLTPSFSGSLFSFFFGVTLNASDEIFIVGANFSGTVWDVVTAKLETDGSFDTSFNSTGYRNHDFGGTELGQGIFLQPDGKVVIAASANSTQAVLARYNADGSIDSTFGTSGVVTTDVAAGASEEWIGVAHTWDGKLVVSGYAGGDVAAARYNAGIGLDQRVWVQQDANFNVTSISNDAGEVVERYRYTPYGQRTVLNDDFTLDGDDTSDYGLDFGHQGLKQDEETGLVYNRARYLHTGLGRFANRDPVRYGDGLNLYAYVRSNPSNLVDPSGETSVYDPSYPAGDITRYPLIAIPILEGLMFPNPLFRPDVRPEYPPLPPGYMYVPTIKKPGDWGPPDHVAVPGGPMDRSCSPTGDCTKDQIRNLRRNVSKACKTGTRACSENQSIEQLRENLAKNQACVDARNAEMYTCWRGGDSDHQRTVAQETRAVATCLRILWSKLAGGS